MSIAAPPRGSRVTTAVIGALVAGVLTVTALGFLGGKGSGAVGAPVSTAASSTPTAPTGLTASVVTMRAVDGRASQPGDVSGAAVAFTIRLTNASAKAIDLSQTVVNATYGTDERPAYGLDVGATAFPGTLQPGGSATGVFVFTIPVADRGVVSVTVDTGVTDTLVAFSGAAPR